MRALKSIGAVAVFLCVLLMLQTASFADSVNIVQRDSYIKDGKGNLRFITAVNLDEGKEATKIGTWVVPKSIFSGWDNDNVVEIEKDISTVENIENKRQFRFTADILNIPANLRNLEFYAKSYIVYKDSNNADKYVQAPLASENVERSEATKKTDVPEDPANQPKYYASTNNEYSNTPEEAKADVNKSFVTFEKVFKNTDKYLYRVGNANTVKLSSLFTANGTPVGVDVKIANKAGKAGGTYTKNATWENGTIQFTGTGVVEVAIMDSRVSESDCTLLLEVVDGKNATTATSATTSNVVLLNDVKGGLSVSGGYTLYGNGFEVRDTRTDTSGSAGYVHISGGVVDNVQFIGYEPTTTTVFGSSSQGYAPAVRVEGAYGTEIYNSYISGGRYACNVQSNTKLYLENVFIDGGAVGNMSVASTSDVTLKNCTTSTSTRGGLKGIGIHILDGSSKLNIQGTFKQYNWVQKSDVPSTYSIYLGSLFDQTEYCYEYGDKYYINPGILFVHSSGVDITESEAKNVIADNSSNNYGYIKQSIATGYIPKSSMGSPEMLVSPQFTPNQHGIIPVTTFDYTTKNYKAKVDGDDNYCYYDSTTSKVNISFEKSTQTPAFEWDPMIFSATKNSQVLNYTVSMNCTDYTNKKISFTDTGDYTVEYTYTDPYNYDKDVKLYSHTYTKKVNLSVSAVEPEDVTYYADFSYKIGNDSVTAKKEIANNKTYVMPNVSATNTNIGSTTVGDKTIYYPIITLDGKSSSNGSYSSGEIWYFAPAFGAINITDYNQDTGTAQYNYNSSNNKWPHGKGATAGPDNSVYSYVVKEGGSEAKGPYHNSTGDTGRSFKNISGLGVCFASGGFGSNRSECDRLIEFQYVSNDGTTYYYYIKYHYKAATYKSGGGGSCVAKGTMVTLANGDLKAIENLTEHDLVMTFNHETGLYEAAPLFMLVTHGVGIYNIMNLSFSDGSALRMIGSHGLFDLDLKQYVDFTEDNYTDFIGHRFAKYAGGQKTEAVTLVSAYITTEETEMMAVFTDKNLNAITEGLVSYDTKLFGTYNYFKYDGNMKYVLSDMKKDIKLYGLYTYDDWSKYLDRATYDAFNFKYFKISIAKGLTTKEELIGYIEWLSDLSEEGGVLFIKTG